EPAAAAQASRGPVLVAEDEDTVRKLAAKALSREGWEVVQAACGDEALALIAARTTPLAALVTDMVMPGADGEAVVRAARSRWPELPVIVTSGYAETLGGEGLGRLGVAWLAKPYTMRDLGRAATRLVGPCAAGASPDPDRAGD
ncbi:MAG: response regulator, partial [Acetobacteraceae bacterium]|nr:response regulator [Acetobacteraceae bacterium]